MKFESKFLYFFTSIFLFVSNKPVQCHAGNFMGKIARQKNAIYPQVAQPSFSRFKALRRKSPVWNVINTTPISDLKKVFPHEEVTFGPGWADAMVIDLENSANDRKLFGELFNSHDDRKDRKYDEKVEQVKKRRTRQIGPQHYGGHYPNWHHKSQEGEIIEADSWYDEETAPPPDGDRSLIPTTDFPAWCKTCEPTKTTTCRPTRPTRPPRTTTCRPTRPTRPPRTTTCRPTRWTTRRTRPTRPPTTTTCEPTTTPTCPTCPTTTKGCRRCCHHSCSSESSSSCRSSEQRTTTTRRPKRRKNKKRCKANWSVDWGFSFGSDSDWQAGNSKSRRVEQSYSKSFSSSWEKNRRRHGRGNRRYHSRRQRRGRYHGSTSATTTTTIKPSRRPPRHQWKRRRTTTTTAAPDYSPDYSSDDTGFAWQPIKRLRSPRKATNNEQRPGNRILMPKPNEKSFEFEFQIPPPTTVETPFFYEFKNDYGDIVPSRSDFFDTDNEKTEDDQQQYIENYDVDFWNVL